MRHLLRQFLGLGSVKKCGLPLRPQWTAPWRPVLVILFLLAFAGLGYTQDHEKSPKQLEKFSIAAIPRPLSTPFFVGVDKGYFRDEGLDVTFKFVPTGRDGLKAMMSGEVDAVGAGDAPIARAAAGGEPIAVIATLAEIQQAVVVIAKKASGIAGPGDLRGKAIGVTRGTGAEYFLHIFLVANFVNPSEVHLVDIQPEKIVDALRNGEVDAVTTWSPYKLVLAETLGAEAVILTDPWLYVQKYNLVTKRDFAERDPERLKKLLRGVMRAEGFIKRNPEESQAIMAKFVGTESEMYRKEWADYSFATALDESLVLVLEDQARWYLKKAADTALTMPNFMDFIDAEPLKAVQPQAVRIIGK